MSEHFLARQRHFWRCDYARPTAAHSAASEGIATGCGNARVGRIRIDRALLPAYNRRFVDSAIFLKE